MFFSFPARWVRLHLKPALDTSQIRGLREVNPSTPFLFYRRSLQFTVSAFFMHFTSSQSKLRISHPLKYLWTLPCFFKIMWNFLLWYDLWLKQLSVCIFCIQDKSMQPPISTDYTFSESLLKMFPKPSLCEQVRSETSPTGLLSGVPLHCLSSFTDYTCVFPVTQRKKKAVNVVFFLKTYHKLFRFSKRNQTTERRSTQLLKVSFCFLFFWRNAFYAPELRSLHSSLAQPIWRTFHCPDEERGTDFTLITLSLPDGCGTNSSLLTRSALTKMSKAKSKNDNKTEKALAAEKEQFNKQQVNHEWSLNQGEYFLDSYIVIVSVCSLPLCELWLECCLFIENVG